MQGRLTRRPSSCRIAAILSACLLAAPAAAQPVAPSPSPEGLPLWEVGAGAGGGWLPHYPAAGQGGFRGLALPYVIYRGDVLRIGEEGFARGRVVDTDRFEFDISLDGSFDAESEDNRARRGMPDLDFLAEAGPQLIWKLHRAEGERLDLALQARAVLSTDFSSLERRGFTAQLRLSYRDEDLLGPRLGVIAGGGPIFATERLHDYFYQVDPAFAAPGRPAYDARGGYMGSEFFVGVVHRMTDRITLYAGGQAGLYAGAANAGSPLHRRDLTGAALAGITWSFWRSAARAPR
ncbi:MAG TPA: MipA/OmpV family protein [Azospirillaceae bacterium]|nr:MipA/OmpV family protein [Azospirillaceae bacterium]